VGGFLGYAGFAVSLSSFRIRKADHDDFEAVLRLSRAHLTPERAAKHAQLSPSSDKRLVGFVDGETGVCLVAEHHDGGLIGYLVGGFKDLPLTSLVYAELETIMVEEGYRGEGVGTELAASFLAWAKERGVDRVAVTVAPKNERALRFYRRLGFVARSLELEKWDL
jgi:ribosomal protein S18 acetylase RimI-like enzyme